VRKIFGFGETLLDIIFKDRIPAAAKPGGSVLNSFVSLGRLGLDPCFISEYGSDQVGDLIEDFLIENGVSTDYVNRFTEGQSALALAFLDRDNNAQYSFYKNFPDQRLQDLPEGLQKDDIIMFGSIYASNAEVRGAVVRFLESARESGGIIIYDPNFREAHLKELDELKPRIVENLNYADIIRGSDDDFRLIFGIEDPAEIPDKIDLGDRILILSRNREPVLVFTREKQISVSVEAIRPVSTIGAGDGFNAGIAYYLFTNGIVRDGLPSLDLKDLEGMARRGIEFSADICHSYDNYISRDFADRILSGG